MYNNFFGFKEKPFKLVPNPVYLFLSKCHEEALAHLKYAISQGDGFVQITGEVGTGKTTLCRAFLEGLDSGTKAAYIFNPKLEPKQLLMTINDEFGIKSEGNTTKELIDRLNAFLMRNKAMGNKVILLIDEAQNLTPDVLEQLRLLSNLETNKDKLLQIVLVGQPELAQMLESRELRQIGQRITLSYNLAPLSFNETREYIQYRISIAAQRQAIKFDRSAYHQIFKYSKGIPRLINIVCDRALLTAFVLNQHKITGSVAKASIRELSGRGTVRSYGFSDGNKGLILISALSLALLVVIYYQPMKNAISALFQTHVSQEPAILHPAESEIESLNYPVQNQKPAEELKPEAAKDIIEPEAAKDIIKPEATEDILKPESTKDLPHQKTTMDLADYLRNMDVASSRFFAIKHALELWNADIEIKPDLTGIKDDQSFFRVVAKPSGLHIHRLDTVIRLLVSLNLPAVLEFYPPGSASPGYLTLDSIDGDRIVLGGAGRDIMVLTALDEIEFYWSGVAYIPWKNFLSIWGTIPQQSYKDSIITLKLLLQDIGFSDFEVNSDYDESTQKAVEKVQAKYGIPVDGFVGPLTKIILYREKESFDMPRLTKK